ncbi:hypothetical protein PTSG_09045 [Salpingoeca rosetta]|uniref:EXS domain-containing protein n=1 Tax=Salpingoeca rosetta (strain ATCC 50818 / BSB-021) TaxID=946362 RepID=F2UM19_SALR5|nr:uncharacterized protein PTSG_09045 [Salpingoeca rosetta]EGD78168.1 hypothetical protein PTSG_09045 [Salpingoeca rosetta]|eukprot:XP_004989844.1 hypothetical protein PTSG_09045 [Salpingoeca rosetta]
MTTRTLASFSASLTLIRSRIHHTSCSPTPIPWSRSLLSLHPTSAQFTDILYGVKTLSLTLIGWYTLHEVFVYYGFSLGRWLAQVAFWVTLLVLCIFSNHKLYRGFRAFFYERLHTFFTFSEVKFVDVLTADALTSMSKLLADMQIVVCSIVGVLSLNFDAGNTRCMHSVVAPVLASLPYLIRAIQCYRAYLSTGSSHHLVNLGKYLSSFPVIWTSALKHQLAPVEGVRLDKHDQYLQLLWLYTVTINTLYSYLWDILMDWGLCRSPRAKHVLLRDDLHFKRPWLYYTAMAGDLALRLCWSLKLSSHLQQHASGQAFAFLFEVLEVFRRFVWNFFRVEWQYIQERHKHTTRELTAVLHTSSPRALT